MTGDEELLPRLRVMQLIVAANMAGAILFLGIVLFLVNNRPAVAGPAPPPLLSWLALAFLAVELPMSVVLPVVQTRNNVRLIANGSWQAPPESSVEAFATDTGKLLAVRLTTLIVAMALLEGAAFLGCIAYLIEGQAVALAVVAVILIVMAARFPTAGSVRGWLDRQAERVLELRQSLPDERGSND